MIRASPPPRHDPRFHVVGCICLWDGKILLLEIATGPHAGCWGIPMGTAESEEAARHAIVRQVRERVSIPLLPEDLDFLAELYVGINGTCTMFCAHFAKRPAVRVNPAEHSRHQWAQLDRIAEPLLVPSHKEIFDLGKPGSFGLLSSLGSSSPLAQTEKTVQRRLGFHPQMWRAATDDFVVVIGPPAVGKTTLLKRYVDSTPAAVGVTDIVPLQRDGRQDNYLTRYLHGDRSSALSCQMETLLLRARQALTVTRASMLDQHIYSSLAYSKALRHQRDLTAGEFETFYQYYCLVESALPVPKAVVHLTARTEVLMRRLRARKRKIEGGFTSRYVSLVSACFEEVAEGLHERSTVFRIDSSDMTRAEVLERFTAHVRGLEA